MTNEQAIDLIRSIRAHADLELDSIRDAARHGADGGFSGFIYYDDTSKFMEAHGDLVWEILSDEAEEFGHESVVQFVATFNRQDMADNKIGLDCLLAWYALERAGHWLIDRQDERSAA